MSLDQQQPGKNKDIVVIDPTVVWADAGRTNAVGKVDEGTILHATGMTGAWYEVQPAYGGTFDNWKKGYVKATEVAPVDDSSMLYDMLLREVDAMRQRYKNNPYVSVTGFTVSVGLPPSVDIDFDFK